MSRFFFTPPTPAKPVTDTSGWLTYHNKTFGYLLTYPHTWAIDSSKAESALDKTKPWCYYDNLLTLTPPGNIGTLSIQYGQTCLGGQASPVLTYKVLMIDGQQARKNYSAICTPDAQSNFTCSNRTNFIEYDANKCLKEGEDTACDYLKILGQSMQIDFSLTDQKNGVVLSGNDSFSHVDSDLDAIVSSIKVPIPPLHPEIP